MKIIPIATLMVTSLLFSLSAMAVENSNNYTLEQVVVFSRHNLRAPLASPTSTLGKITPKSWPDLDTTPGYLTERGGALESYFGHYFQEWLIDNKLFDENQCPTDKDVYIYTNSLQRTIATGQFFVVGAFPGCTIPVVHKEKLGTMDPLFFPVIRNNSAEFKTAATASINQTAGPEGLTGLNNQLKNSYQEIATIIDYPLSVSCVTDQQCDFTAQTADIKIEAGQEPAISGSLRTGTSIADAFILQYYEGMPIEQIAWGGIKNEQQLRELVTIKEYYNQVIFGSPVIAHEVANRLANYISDALINHDDKARFTFLVGHDSNVSSLLTVLGIKPYQLPYQFEATPIGGKIVFSRWKDANNTALLKIEYVYQSNQQLHNLEPLSLRNPPQRVTLEMKGCPIDESGFCHLADFQKTIQLSLANPKPIIDNQEKE